MLLASASLLASARLDTSAPPQPDVSYEYFVGSKTDRSHRPEIVQAEPLTVEGTIPAWLKGAYYVAGPHLQQIGSTRVQHFLDGLGMVYKFDLSPVSQTATWQTRWIRSEIYNRSMALGHEAAAPQFMETVPPRNYSAVRNVLFGVNDNTYVAMKPAADGCSMLGTTDDTYVTRFSADLQSFTRLSWTDKLVPKLHQALQVAHPVVNSSTGGMTGLLIVSPELPLGKPFAAVFRVSPEEEQRRVLVGQRIPLSQAPYMHSFGLSDRHAVICEHGWRIDSEALLSGKMFEGAAVVDDKMPTRFHVLELASGELTTHTSSDAFLCLHFANVHHNGSALVFDSAPHKRLTPTCTPPSMRVHAQPPAWHTAAFRPRPANCAHLSDGWAIRA
jgi:carotenoid cleavage dioxygenase-like enzyme